jgi:hypothetical protein
MPQRSARASASDRKLGSGWVLLFSGSLWVCQARTRPQDVLHSKRGESRGTRRARGERRRPRGRQGVGDIHAGVGAIEWGYDLKPTNAPQNIVHKERGASVARYALINCERHAKHGAHTALALRKRSSEGGAIHIKPMEYSVTEQTSRKKGWGGER